MTELFKPIQFWRVMEMPKPSGMTTAPDL